MERKIADIVSSIVGYPAELIEVHDMFADFEDYETEVLYRARHQQPDFIAQWWVLLDPEAGTLRILAEMAEAVQLEPCDELETLRQAVLADMPTRYETGPH